MCEDIVEQRKRPIAALNLSYAFMVENENEYVGRFESTLRMSRLFLRMRCALHVKAEINFVYVGKGCVCGERFNIQYRQTKKIKRTYFEIPSCPRIQRNSD